jgi:hypothetical protein
MFIIVVCTYVSLVTVGLLVALQLVIYHVLWVLARLDVVLLRRCVHGFDVAIGSAH